MPVRIIMSISLIYVILLFHEIGQPGNLCPLRTIRTSFSLYAYAETLVRYDSGTFNPENFQDSEEKPGC